MKEHKAKKRFMDLNDKAIEDLQRAQIERAKKKTRTIGLH